MTLADVFRQHGPEYLRRYGGRMPASHRAAIDDILRCHTPECGGSLYGCEECGRQRFAYHRCGNRACDGCGHAHGQAWLEAQTERLLPVEHFLLTFTIPEPLREIFRRHQRVCFSLLFSESAAALQEVAGSPRALGGDLGLLGVLHTWTRQLVYHPHVHYLAPGVALGKDGALSFPKNPEYLLPVQRLSARFRTRLRRRLMSEQPELYAQVPKEVWRRPWVVHCQHAGRGKEALGYLSRYIYRTAISSARLLSQDERSVTFSYRDSATGSEETVTIPGEEFLRRFLQHVLPRGFHRVRRYGFLAPAAKERFERVCALLGALCAPKPVRVRVSAAIVECPHCRKPMRHMARFRPAPA